MLDISDFKPVTLDDRNFFKSFYERFPIQHSDNTFTNMVCWNDYAQYEYYTNNDALVISSTIENKTSFRGPFGIYDDNLLKEVLKLAKKTNHPLAYQIFDEETKARILALYPDINLSSDRDYYDYVYKTDILSKLPGKKFLNIRKHINSFKKRCNYTTEPMTSESVQDVIDFFFKWCEWKECKKNPIMNYEKNATIYSVKHFEQLGLCGLLLKNENEISAISIYEELNKDTIVIHYEKGLPDCEGNYKVINNEVARLVSGKYDYINRESDLGIDGLRIAKMRYYPEFFAKVYNIDANDIPEI
ncbi:phosphatidylglycerol lysyltransferase domain-containing protein [Methanomicrobium antiquum]|uniref:Phosphatidylglycerol lysyltransferase domain-containing protein n=1 Tax=Methanomicrobium antiquum TaxID=487686 RepID=A0AAF0FZT2_9EURY|nr:phosphatidylglycerol lysyltransferase domain-containing protein [Methanomicrobium antiquum]WFN37534.1 phosphatidylglycerol lysyltransferase domain-containing protein [Methanomicrobium antiquum]